MKTQIIYEDKQLLVIYKPEGFPAQSARVTQPDVVSELSSYLLRAGETGKAAQQPYVGLVHRLDQPVEGLMVVAKTKEAAADLSRQITGGELEKTYLAVVYEQEKDDVIKSRGQASESVDTSITAQGPDAMTTLVSDMYKDAKQQKAIIIEPQEKQTSGAKTQNNRSSLKIVKAVLRYRKLCSGSDHTALMEIKLETGRFHQIRAQMSHAGMPLLGDLKYGSLQSQQLSREKNVKETALCAYKLSFLHPKTKKAMQFEIKPHKPVFNSYEF